jgi:hypothetical protein
MPQANTATLYGVVFDILGWEQKPLENQFHSGTAGRMAVQARG